MNETSGAHNANYVTGMRDAQLWIKLRIARLALPRTLSAQMSNFVAKNLAPKILFRQSMEQVMQKAQGIDTGEFLPSAFPDQDIRLVATQHLLGENLVLPDKDPDFQSLNDDITEACGCRLYVVDRGAPSEGR